MAEFIFKAFLQANGLEDQFYVESAATSTEEIGNPIYPPAMRCLKQHGILFNRNKTARQIRREDYDIFNLIICMDRLNLSWIRHIIPSDPQEKIHLLMSYTGSGRDVADPWYTGDFETTFQDISSACEAMIKNLL